jgi:FkbM family methyltransferase
MGLLSEALPHPFKGLYNTVISHPLTRDQKLGALLRFARWQIGSRILGKPVVIPYVEGTRLLLERGMTGATGNMYAGLHEFEDQSFVLHALRPSSGFIDIGANVGMYTILAGGVAGARFISAEPVPATYNSLRDNVRLNNLCDIGRIHNIGLGKEKGQLEFSDIEKSGGNRVLQTTSQDQGVEIPVTTLDDFSKHISSPDDVLVFKIDVEGWEAAVLEGGSSVLSRSQPAALVVELNGWGSRYGFDDDKVHDDLVSWGYNPVDYNPFSRSISERSYRCSKGNTIYVNDIPFFSRLCEESKSYSVLDKKV